MKELKLTVVDMTIYFVLDQYAQHVTFYRCYGCVCVCGGGGWGCMCVCVLILLFIIIIIIIAVSVIIIIFLIISVLYSDFFLFETWNA